MAITLFRHGITMGNKMKQYLGWNDSPLSEEAIQELLAYSLDQKPYDLFLSSDLQRCLTTFSLLFPEEHPITLTELREMDFGIFAGKTYEELKESKAYQSWLNQIKQVKPPGGESYALFTTRVQKGWDKVRDIIIDNGATNPFIVTHGGVIRYLLSRYGPVEKSFWEWNIPHGTGIVLLFNQDQLRRGERCTLLREVLLTENEDG
ncbi:histidine phosphatase family protein [Oceanobacillus senegalensis]|uniref:histidine phosphatase family protein n=1 Tax=Oceanobacillus senegalensis TaxID=1936063 RepID=UPI001FE7803A|nr:histidine phosphatase family protein [Oceanobacillus senegalensis]